MENFWKKTAAGLLALLIVAGASPVAPFSQVFERSAITASADGDEDDGFTTVTTAEEFVDAFTEEKDGKKIRLGADIYYYDSSLAYYGADGVLDLNGHTLYVMQIGIGENCSLTVEDSGEGGKIEYYYNSECTIMLYCGGKLTLNSGTIEYPKSEDNKYCAIDVFNGTLIINGGTVAGDYSIWRDHSEDNIIINGGNIVGGFRETSGSLTITGGTFSFDPSTYTDNFTFDSAHYKVTDNGDDTYTVEKMPKTITIDESVSNGTVTADKTSAAEGDTVTLTVTPDAGYAVKSVKYNDTVIEPVEGAYSFTMPAEDVTVTAEFEKPISSASLTLGDDLGLNFYMSSAITDENAADYTVKFEGECLEDEATLTKNESTGKYYATAHVYAKNLDKKITAKLYKGEEVICTTEYSVADYLEKAPGTVTDEKALALIKATKAFGAMSADYFYEGEHGFSAAYNEYLTQSGLTNEDIVNNAKNNYAAEFTTDDAKISLVLDEKTAIRLYVKGVQPDGENLKPSKQANKDVYPSYYEIAGLTPDKLADEQTVTIGGTEYKFSALSWANRILDQEDPSEKNLNMAKAVTAYYLAAHDYYVDQHTVDLSQLTATYYAKDGDILTGTTDRQIYVSGVKVTLKDAEAQNGIYCEYNSTILLEGTNKAPIQIQRGTLTIDGEGSLVANGSSGYAGIGGGSKIGNGANLIINGGNITATGGSQAAGIGGNIGGNFGNITINGGTVTAIGGEAGCPGIGTGTNGGNYSKCGDITINGGTVTAIGTLDAPGIGSVYSKECGNITIADTVEKVTVTKGEDAPYSIGVDNDSDTKCGTITIGGNVYYEDGAYVNGGDTYLTQDEIVYPAPIDLSALTEDYEAKDGDTLTGTLGENVKISVADGATVTLKDVTINGVNDENYQWAGITCNGNAKLILEGTNSVSGFYWIYPGVYIAPEKTLTIDGTGSLNASSLGGAGIGGGYMINCGNIIIEGGTVSAEGGESAAGIGGGSCDSCGNIVINGGTVTANGGVFGAGIGSPNGSTCGDITINGGTVTAKGGALGAGIGCAYYSECGNITIADTVTKVTATKGDDAPDSIGACQGYCGTVTIAEGANVEQN